MYITTDKELALFCEGLKHEKMLAIDTEFVREKTYFHRLGLLQVAGNGQCVAIDPITVSDLSPLLSLVKDPSILKVFHAGKQDLEILYRLIQSVVKPVFDTQVAAAILGWGPQISFAKVVQKVTGKRISKAETYSDWCRRPLSKSQISYAIDDVRYLVPVYEHLSKTLEKMGRMDWVEEELAPLMADENFRLNDPRKQFLKIKNVRSLKPRNMAVLRELAAFREEEAVRRDCLAKFIIRDEPLLEMARVSPTDKKTLGQIRGFHSKELHSSGDEIIRVIEKGLSTRDEDLPSLPETKNYSTRKGVEELLAAFVQVRSEEMKIEAHILADRKLIHDFVRCFEQKQDLDRHLLLKGWRKGLIGDDLKLILRGEKGLTINEEGKVDLVQASKSTLP